MRRHPPFFRRDVPPGQASVAGTLDPTDLFRACVLHEARPETVDGHPAPGPMNGASAQGVHPSTRSLPMIRALRYLAIPALAGLVTGCTVRTGPPPVGVQATVSTTDYYATAYPTVPPPAPIYEYRPPPPGWGYVWIDGYWDWTGYDWTWVPGFWEAERPGYIYVRPTYVFDGGHWIYRRSYWDGGGRRDYYVGRGAPWTATRGVPPRPAGGPYRGAPPPAGYPGNPNRGAPGPSPYGGFHQGPAAGAPPPAGGFHPAPGNTGAPPPAPAYGGGFHPAPAPASPAPAPAPNSPWSGGFHPAPAGGGSPRPAPGPAPSPSPGWTGGFHPAPAPSNPGSFSGNRPSAPAPVQSNPGGFHPAPAPAPARPSGSFSSGARPAPAPVQRRH